MALPTAKDLVFPIPSHKEGRNITIRRGFQWSTEDCAKIDSLGVVPIKTKLMRCCDIKENDLKDFNDPECQSYAGLVSVMKRLYGPEFEGTEIVTVIEYFKPPTEIKE